MQTPLVKVKVEAGTVAGSRAWQMVPSHPRCLVCSRPVEEGRAGAGGRATGGAGLGRALFWNGALQAGEVSSEGWRRVYAARIPLGVGSFSRPAF